MSGRCRDDGSVLRLATGLAAACIGAAFLAGCAGMPPPEAIAEDPGGPIAEPDPEAWLAAEETAALLESLPEDAAEELAAELARLGWQAPEPAEDTGRAPRSAPRRSPTGAAEWRLRSSAAGPVSTALVQVRAGPASGSLRHGGLPGEEELGGWLSVGRPGGRVLAGGLGVQHGLGLLMAAPGRRRGLSAGGSLLPSAAGPRMVARPDADGSLLGAAVGGAAGSWSLLMGAGQPASAKAGTTADWLRLERVAAAARGAVLLQRTPAAGGASLAGSLGTGGSSSLAVEAAAWEPAGGGREAAWAAAGHLRTGRWRLEGQTAAAAAGGAPPLGQRPAALPGWQGAGWAVAARGPLAEAIKGRFLLAGGWNRKPGSADPRTVATTVAEGTCTARLRTDLEAEGRIRVSGRAIEARGAAPPWQPPTVVDQERRTTLALRLRWSRPDLRLALDCRSLTLEDHAAGVDPAAPRRRTLMGLHAAWDRRSWRLRGAWEWAWGEDVDLVGACQPLAGVVLPRHWGRWAAGGTAGVERRAAGWSAGVGGAVRLPAGGPPGGFVTEVFLRGRAGW